MSSPKRKHTIRGGECLFCGRSACLRTKPCAERKIENERRRKRKNQNKCRWRAANREHVREYEKQYRKENLEDFHSRDRERYKKECDKRIAYQKMRRERDPEGERERSRISQKKRRESHRDEVRLYHKEYQAKLWASDPDSYRENIRQYQRKKAIGSVLPELRKIRGAIYDARSLIIMEGKRRKKGKKA